MSMNLSLDRVTAETLALRRGMQAGRPKPHKLAMLLAVLDLADKGLIRDNRIYYGLPLLTRFRRYFAMVAEDGDWCQPGPPFFHLRSSGFWKHKVKAGCEQAYASLTTSGGGSKRILDTIEYAYLADYAFAAFSDRNARHTLRQTIASMLPPVVRQRASLSAALALGAGTPPSPAVSVPIPRLVSRIHEALPSALDASERREVRDAVLAASADLLATLELRETCWASVADALTFFFALGYTASRSAPTMRTHDGERP
jgi:hypothetical protein